MKPTREEIEQLLRAVASTEAAEIDCEEFLARVAAYLESLQAGDEPPRELRSVGQHLDVCPQCREEFDALLELYVEP